MHTDEYSISMGREISLCRKMIKKWKKFPGKAGEAMRPDDGRVSASPGGGQPVPRASHPGLATGISSFAVLATEVEGIRRSPGER
jgi:hypothetical protein